MFRKATIIVASRNTCGFWADYEDAELVPAAIRWEGIRLRLFPSNNLQVLNTALIHDI